MKAIKRVIARGYAPREVVPLLLDELFQRDPVQAAWFADAWDEVLREMRRDEVTDAQMWWDCLRGLEIQLRALAPEGMTFERHGAEWGFWDLAR